MIAILIQAKESSMGQRLYLEGDKPFTRQVPLLLPVPKFNGSNQITVYVLPVSPQNFFSFNGRRYDNGVEGGATTIS
jgi:hypothetical protein